MEKSIRSLPLIFLFIHESLFGAATLGAEKELITLAVESRRKVIVDSRTAKERNTRFAAAAAGIGYEMFSHWWVTERLAVGLQLRLWVESVLFSMNKPWSTLVSGFRPLRVPLGSWKPPS